MSANSDSSVAAPFALLQMPSTLASPSKRIRSPTPEELLMASKRLKAVIGGPPRPGSRTKHVGPHLPTLTPVQAIATEVSAAFNRTTEASPPLEKSAKPSFKPPPSTKATPRDDDDDEGDSNGESDNVNSTDDDDSDASVVKKPISAAKPKSKTNQAALPIKRQLRKHGMSAKLRAKARGGQ